MRKAVMILALLAIPLTGILAQDERGKYFYKKAKNTVDFSFFYGL